MKRVFWILVLLVICAGTFFWWQNHKKSTALNDGDVACEGCMSPERQAIFLKENAGEDSDGQKEHKSTSHNVSADEAGSKTTTTVATTTTPAATTSTPAAATTTTTTVGTTTYPAATPAAPVASTVTYSGPAAATTMTATNVTTARTPAGAPPAYDSIAPNAPNGAIFTGSGSYQWYRQGNLTWRVDSRTGRSCIVFATDEEWRKERVLSHGCGKSA